MTEKSPVQKLLIKPEYQVLLIHPPAGYEAILGPIPAADLEIDRASGRPDAVIAFLENRADLEARLPEIQPLLTPKTLLWLCYHKGTSKVKTDINRDTINAFCIGNGLQGVAMVSIDDDWSALRLKPRA